MFFQAVIIFDSILGYINLIFVISHLYLIIFVSLAMLSLNLFLFEVRLIYFKVVKLDSFFLVRFIGTMGGKSFGFWVFANFLLF